MNKDNINQRNGVLSDIDMLTVYGGNADKSESNTNACSSNKNCTKNLNTPVQCKYSTTNQFCKNGTINDRTLSDSSIINSAPDSIKITNIKGCEVNGKLMPDNHVMFIYNPKKNK